MVLGPTQLLIKWYWGSFLELIWWEHVNHVLLVLRVVWRCNLIHDVGIATLYNLAGLGIQSWYRQEIF